MKRTIEIVVPVLAILLCTNCFADCNCSDWVNRGGYCVDYVRSRIPTFPIPKDVAEISVLKNREVRDVDEGDVAIFDLRHYWHVAYVEKVHRDRYGAATAIDVSEQNFGGQMSFDDYVNRWSPKNESEWKRATCCGVTEEYDLTGVRKNIPLNSVTQIWSPTVSASRGTGERRGNPVFNKVREVLNLFILATEKYL